MRNSIIISLLFLIASLSGCNQSNNDITFIKGTVVNEEDAPLEHVIVSIGDQIIETNTKGEYQCPISVRDKYRNISFRRKGYTNHFVSQDNLKESSKTIMYKKDDDACSILVDTDSDSICKIKNAEIKISGKSFTDAGKNNYKGDCVINFESFPWNSNIFGGIHPGGKVLSPYVNNYFYAGFAKISANTNDKQPLSLKKGESIELSFYLPFEIKYNAPETISFWRYDEEQSC